MGSAVAATCAGERCWASVGRSAASRERADAAGLIDAGDIVGLVARCDTIVSICPPDQAAAVARDVAAAGFTGTYVDANAVSPATAHDIASVFDHYVDGGIIGPPPIAAGTTRMYLSGDLAPEIACRWSDSLLDVRAIDGGVGAASALKMVFAGWTKGTSALLLALNAAAESYGVAEALRDEWSISLPDLSARSQRTARGTAPKAWRFAGEMHEIASTLEAAGLPPGFHLAAAEIFSQLADFRDADPPPDLDAVIAAISTQ